MIVTKSVKRPKKGELVEFKTTAEKQHKTKNATPYFLTSSQRKYLIKEVGLIGYVLFAFYMEKANYTDGYDYSDEKVANVLGLSARKVMECRWALTKLGWFALSTFTDNRGVKVTITYLGKDAVETYKSNGNAVMRLTRVTG